MSRPLLDQATIVEPGTFRTSIAADNMVEMPLRLAYDTPTSAAVLMRRVVHTKQDPEKAADAIYRLSWLPKPPLRLSLGKDCLHMYRE